MDIIICLISSLYILVIIHKFSVFRSNRCNRWLKAYDRKSIVVYKFFTFNRFHSREILRFSWSILWSLAVTLFFKPLFGQWWRWKTYAKKSHVLCIFGESTQQILAWAQIFSVVCQFLPIFVVTEVWIYLAARYSGWSWEGHRFSFLLQQRKAFDSALISSLRKAYTRGFNVEFVKRSISAATVSW